MAERPAILRRLRRCFSQRKEAMALQQAAGGHKGQSHSADFIIMAVAASIHDLRAQRPVKPRNCRNPRGLGLCYSFPCEPSAPCGRGPVISSKGMPFVSCLWSEMKRVRMVSSCSIRTAVM